MYGGLQIIYTWEGFISEDQLLDLFNFALVLVMLQVQFQQLVADYCVSVFIEFLFLYVH